MRHPQPQENHHLVTIAVLVSRVEALCLADMLNAEGIAVHVGANAHASVEFVSLALGGHRIWVPACQYDQASGLIREAGIDQNWTFSRGPQRAILRFLALFLGLQTLLTGLGALIGSMSWLAVLMTPVTILSVPVNPQGRGDYFLIAADEEA